MMEYLVPEGNPPKKELLRKLEESDVVLAIYAYRYGAILKGDKISIIEHEYELAIKKKKKICFFMPHKDLEKEWPAEYREDREELRKFRGKILREHNVQFFRNPDQLRFQITQALGSHASNFDLKLLTREVGGIMKVYVSSSYEDLKGYREAVRDAIIARGYQPLMMEYFVPEGEPPKEECLKRLREADVVIAIYAFQYGSILKGEKKSITELEYELAIRKKKKVFFFMPHKDLEKKWPIDQREDREELRHFRGKILSDHFVQFFKSADDLKFLVTKTLPREKKTDIQKALEDARDEAKAVSHEDRLDMIEDLVEDHHNGLLNDEGLRLSTNLIASDFTSFAETINPSYIFATAELLTNTIKRVEYVKIANRYTSMKNFWKHVRKVTLPYFTLILIGLLVGILSYRFNWGDVRSKYLAPKDAQRLDIINWLMNKYFSENIDYVEMKDISGPKKVKAIAALSFAFNLDPENEKLNSIIDKVLKDVKRNTQSKYTSYEILQENRMILEEIYKYIPTPSLFDEINYLTQRIEENKEYQAALSIQGELEKKSQDSTVSNLEMLQSYQNLWRNYYKFIDSVIMKQKISSLQELKNQYEKLNSLQFSDTVTISQKLDLWQQFINSQTPCFERNHAVKEISNIRNLKIKYASIESDDKFVTCRNVYNKEPQGRATKFSPGIVWIWAQLRVPQPERVILKWYIGTELFDTEVFQLDPPKNTNTLIIFSFKNYDISNKGRNEVRIYNSQNHLIARRVFYIGQ